MRTFSCSELSGKDNSSFITTDYPVHINSFFTSCPCSEHEYCSNALIRNTINPEKVVRSYRQAIEIGHKRKRKTVGDLKNLEYYKAKAGIHVYLVMKKTENGHIPVDVGFFRTMPTLKKIISSAIKNRESILLHPYPIKIPKNFWPLWKLEAKSPEKRLKIVRSFKLLRELSTFWIDKIILDIDMNCEEIKNRLIEFFKTYLNECPYEIYRTPKRGNTRVIIHLRPANTQGKRIEKVFYRISKKRLKLYKETIDRLARLLKTLYQIDIDLSTKRLNHPFWLVYEGKIQFSDLSILPVYMVPSKYSPRKIPEKGNYNFEEPKEGLSFEEFCEKIKKLHDEIIGKEDENYSEDSEHSKRSGYPTQEHTIIRKLNLPFTKKVLSGFFFIWKRSVDTLIKRHKKGRYIHLLQPAIGWAKYIDIVIRAHGKFLKVASSYLKTLIPDKEKDIRIALKYARPLKFFEKDRPLEDLDLASEVELLIKLISHQGSIKKRKLYETFSDRKWLLDILLELLDTRGIITQTKEERKTKSRGRLATVISLREGPFTHLLIESLLEELRARHHKEVNRITDSAKEEKATRQDPEQNPPSSQRLTEDPSKNFEKITYNNGAFVGLWGSEGGKLWKLDKIELPEISSNLFNTTCRLIDPDSLDKLVSDYTEDFTFRFEDKLRFEDNSHQSSYQRNGKKSSRTECNGEESKPATEFKDICNAGNTGIYNCDTRICNLSCFPVDGFPALANDLLADNFSVDDFPVDSLPVGGADERVFCVNSCVDFYKQTEHRQATGSKRCEENRSSETSNPACDKVLERDFSDDPVIDPNNPVIELLSDFYLWEESIYALKGEERERKMEFLRMIMKRALGDAARLHRELRFLAMISRTPVVTKEEEELLEVEKELEVIKAEIRELRKRLKQAKKGEENSRKPELKSEKFARDHRDTGAFNRASGDDFETMYSRKLTERKELRATERKLRKRIALRAGIVKERLKNLNRHIVDLLPGEISLLIEIYYWNRILPRVLLIDEDISYVNPFCKTYYTYKDEDEVLLAMKRTFMYLLLLGSEVRLSDLLAVTGYSRDFMRRHLLYLLAWQKLVKIDYRTERGKMILIIKPEITLEALIQVMIKGKALLVNPVKKRVN